MAAVTTAKADRYAAVVITVMTPMAAVAVAIVIIIIVMTPVTAVMAAFIVVAQYDRNATATMVTAMADNDVVSISHFNDCSLVACDAVTAHWRCI